jgi:enoyl-CoA hydratase/carnithine racemase
LENHGATTILRLNKMQTLNALDNEIMGELSNKLKEIEEDDKIKIVVLTGQGNSFAAGANISEMSQLSTEECLKEDFLSTWNQIANFRKPLIAAVNGYAVKSYSSFCSLGEG